MTIEAHPVAVWGAGGHGRVVLDALLRSGREVLCFLDDGVAGEKGPHRLDGLPVEAPERLGRLPEELGVCVAVGVNATRETVTERVIGLGRTLVSAIHPSAQVGGHVLVGGGTVLFAQTAVNPGTRLGVGVIVNTGASVDHDCAIGDFVHIAPGARLAGDVVVGPRTLVGIGAVVLPGVRVGADCRIGAGAVVVDDLPDGATVKGVPAR